MRHPRLGMARVSGIVLVASSCTVAQPASDRVPEDALRGDGLRSAVSFLPEATGEAVLLDAPWFSMPASIGAGLPHPSRTMPWYDLVDTGDGSILRPNLTVAMPRVPSVRPSWTFVLTQGVRFLALPEDVAVVAADLVRDIEAAMLSADPSGGSDPPVSQPSAPGSCSPI